MDLRDTIIDELALSQRIIRDGHEVVPRFTVFGPDGTYTVMVQLSDDPVDRIKRMQLVGNFMVWKAAQSFLLANEFVEPDAISVVAVVRGDAIGALQMIHRAPLGFNSPEWFGRESVGDEIANLLPPRSRTVTHEELQFMRQAFEKGSIPGITWRRHGD